MTTQNYSHMVDGDSVGDDGGEEALEIPLFGVETMIYQPSENEDCGGGGALFCKKLHPPSNVGF
jgi:hypothetical protein